MKFHLKHIIVSLILFGIALSTYSQDSISVPFVNKIVALSLDANSNIFIADDDNTLYKLDKNGDIITNVNVKVYGNIDKIDCTNPFEIYTYHKDQNIVVYYDNMLNIRGETRLNELYYNAVSSIARSYDNGLWLFDYSTNKIIKLDKHGNVQAESVNLVNIISKDLNVFDIIEFNHKVYLCDSVTGIIQFDIYATYSTTYFVSNLKALTLNKVSSFISINGKLQNYNFLSRDYLELEAHVPALNSITISEDKIYSYHNNLILVFSAN